MISLTTKQYYDLCNHIDVSELQEEINKIPVPKKIAEKDLPENLNETPLRIILELREQTWDNDYTAISKVLKCYLGEEIDIDNLSIEQTFPAAMFIIREVERLNKQESEKLGYKPSNEEKAAGIDKLKQLGNFMLIDSIALRMGISHDAVLDLPYLLVFMMQWKDKELADYKERLNRLMEKKNERKNKDRGAR